MIVRPEQSEQTEIQEPVKPKRKKNMSLWANLMNKANANKSTGPKTVEGKNISKMNGVKHGFCSIHVTEDENQDEIVRLRSEWFADLKPEGAAQENLADLAFRHLRRLERAMAAEEAVTAALAADAAESVRSEHRRFLDMSVALLETDPVEGVAHLRATADGIGVLLRTLDEFDDAVEEHEWCPRRTARMLAIEGGREPLTHEVLDATTRLFDRRRSDERVVRESRGLDDDPGARGARNLATLRMKEYEKELNMFTGLLKERIERARTWLLEERVIALADEAALVRAAVDAAKFDDSESGRLLRRHIADAQRDHLRVLRELKALQRASGRDRKPKPAPKPEPLNDLPDRRDPVDRFDPPPTNFVPISATPPPNAPRTEPISRYDDINHRKTRPRPPAELKRRKRG